MSEGATTATEEIEGSDQVPGLPKSSAIAGKGIATGHDFVDLMSSVMSDVIDGRLTPRVANAVCNAGGKLLKVVELQIQHGTDATSSERKTLQLSR